MVKLLIEQEMDAQPFVRQLRAHLPVIEPIDHEAHRGKRRLHLVNPR